MEITMDHQEATQISINHQEAAQISTKPTFKAVIMEALRVKYCGLAMDPVIRRAVHDELEHVIPQVINQTAFLVSQQMSREMERMISQFNAQVDHIMRQQVEYLADYIIARTQLPRFPQLHNEEAEPALNLQLVFTEKLLRPMFYTEDEIKDKDNNHLKVALMRTEHGQSSVFPLEPPIQVKIVVIDGDFPASNDTDWSTDEFNSNIKKERRGRRPLLVEECFVTLHQGIASFGSLRLTDNSSRVSSRKFRLGVKVSPGSYQGPRIKEGITEPFTVLDQRGKLNQKFYPPSLHHEVWRLDNIRRDGEYDKRLASAGIKTVQDFLKLSVVDQQHLQKIMKMSGRKWDETIDHARTCRMEDEEYLYHGQPYTVILNPICEVSKIRIDGSTYTPEQLDPQQKPKVQKLVKEAFQNWEKLEKVVMGSSSNASGAQEQNNSMRDAEPEPQIFYHNAILGSQNGLFASRGDSANVPGQLPPQQIANAQNRVPPEGGIDGMSSIRTTEARQDNHSTEGGLESSWSPNDWFYGSGTPPSSPYIGNIWQ